MLRRQLMAGFVTLLMSLTAYGQVPQQSMKGYELYSWKVKGKWHYSLFVGTNRAKTYGEITSRGAERIGIEALEAELKKIPRGGEVFWMGDAPAGARRPATDRAIDFKHPSRKRIESVRAICDKLGIQLRLA
ncbi:MAG: hypothetical protein AABO57_23930 [Acidobacteriota bacterium]